MSRYDDHVPCPGLDRWLSGLWRDRVVARVAARKQPRWSPPRSLRRMLARQQVPVLDDAPEPASVDVLVLLSALPGADPQLAEASWQALRPGGLLIDLGTAPRRRVTELLRPWVYLRRTREATVGRVRHFLERGAYEPEQWIAIDPPDVVVTLVRRAVRSGRLAS